MKVCGYIRDTEEYVDDLREASIVCTMEELDKIIQFLEHVKVKHQKAADHSSGYHSHYQDWDSEWKDEETDIIIISK